MNDPYSYFAFQAASVRDEIQDIIHGSFFSLQTKCGSTDPTMLKIWECLNEASDAMRVACMESCKLGTGDNDD